MSTPTQPGPSVTREQCYAVYPLYYQGAPLHAAASFLGTTAMSLHRAFRRNSLPVRPRACRGEARKAAWQRMVKPYVEREHPSLAASL